MPKNTLKKKKARKLEMRKLVLDGKGHNWQGNIVSFAGAKYFPGEVNMERDLRNGYKDPTMGKSQGHKSGGKKKGGGSKSGDEKPRGGRGGRQKK